MTEEYRGRKKKLILLSSVLVALIVFGVAGFLSIHNTPRYSLYWFKKAILEHNAESALKYLDIDSIVDNMVKDIFDKPEQQKVTSKNQPETSMKSIGKDIVMQNLPTMKKQLREQLESAIISYNDQAALDNLSKASVLGLVITMEGDLALVKIRGKDTVAFTMAKSPEGRWKIVAFNLKELIAPGRK
ncbi:MAG: hypothetical protein C0399_09185 [Syntrophus sp. (in: bacteria)]|nr:hypothetical protein [Syntrophus sp. (in: bacteria)]